MRSYEGDIDGRFMYSSQCEKLEQYGITLEESWCWCGCRCCLQDEDEEYCTMCYESKEDHKNQVEEDDDVFEPVFDGFGCSITRDKFNKIAVPWMNQHSDFEKYIKHLSYDEKCQECSVKNDTREFADYLLLKHIQHFFKTHDEDECAFHADEN